MFDKIPETTFEEIQLNAGVMLYDFDPKTGTLNLDNIVGATSGGVAFSATPEFVDFGEDIDNAPKNMKELKQLTQWTIEMSGTFVTINPGAVKSLIAASDIDTEDSTHIIPRNELVESDYKDIWWVGDYSNKGDKNTSGFLAIHMLNTLSTGGFATQSTDGGKGTFEFTFTAHYSMKSQDTVPFEVYVKSGAASVEGEVSETI